MVAVESFELFFIKVCFSRTKISELSSKLLVLIFEQLINHHQKSRNLLEKAMSGWLKRHHTYCLLYIFRFSKFNLFTLYTFLFRDLSTREEPSWPQN